MGNEESEGETYILTYPNWFGGAVVSAIGIIRGKVMSQRHIPEYH